MEQAPITTVQAAGPQLILTKSVEGNVTTAEVGDEILYRIRFECSSLVGPCGPMEITDVLQSGLTYEPPPASSVPAGFTITESPPGTITITKDDNNLLDGSQYDAVIAVRVSYDLRPLPATINNTVNGRIAPTGIPSWIDATPASAPPITIGTANPYWALTKTLSSPQINPTVDTDVTYQIQLCPTAPPPGQGNVPLTNVVITDNLPPGATFVSATNGGTQSGGVVTWPAIPGPIYPPSCVTRYVTIRYNSPTFSVGDSVTNTASATGDYNDSSGALVGPVALDTTPITHPIDPISEVPTYSKSDVGDPVGISGTGRFVLHLDTFNTNFPSNELILIDNLPPELQVTSVTSGGWDASFAYVEAFVEYSTNNGSSYTAFPGQPISYNSNATYVAPVANITNVRWRFEYDPDGQAPYAFTQPGLPYTWSFTTDPQIRITPRSVATVSDPPPVGGSPMPAAVAGSTYTNCLQVSRRDHNGNLVTDPCFNEPMTVAGNQVNLRTSKNETPGTGWDDLDDPQINTFTADGTILPGDTVKYTITVEITERSSAPLINPTIQDTLPAASDFVFVRNGTAQLDGVNLPAGQQPVFNQTGQVLTWSWNNPSPALTVNPLPLGSHFLTLDFYGRIPRGQAPGSYTNNLYVVTNSVATYCEVPTQVTDTADVDGDGNTSENACQNPDTYVVERSAALRGEKWIRSNDPSNSEVVDATTFLPPSSGSCPNGGSAGLPGGGSNDFTRFPCIAQAFPDGALTAGQFVPPPISTTMDDFEYNLRIFNDGNVPMLSYYLYDILPYVGDTGSGGTLVGTPRLSDFNPTLRGPVQFISGPGLTGADFDIEYNSTTNPCRPEVFDQPTGTANVPPGCDNTWTATWSAAARSYRISLNAGSYILPASTSSEVRFGVPMSVPADAITHQIAWNSFAHVGSYDKNPSSPPVVVQDLLASEPRKVGITVPERMSVGNRVWRDSDNSGTINPPDDTNPGIAGVTVDLYRDANNDGIADGAAIATTTTDAGGYYLFSNIPYDSSVMNNNRYIIGIPAGNFAAGQPLFDLRSSTGTPASATYTNPAANNGDSNDNGVDVTPGLEVFSASFVLQPGTEPTAESDLSANLRDGAVGESRGVNGEQDNNSDLTIDFGFFGGTDIPFSLGNRVWYDNGQGGGIVNDGIRQSNEPPAVGVRVNLYRDGNLNGIPEPSEFIRYDITDAGGYYLFDNLDPGQYFVEIPASEFAAGKPLAGWYSSQPTGTATVGVDGGTATADLDNDDNGVNALFPEVTGVLSGPVVLTRGVDTPTGETDLSGDTSSAPGFDPTAGDGPGSIGRFGETDNTSNLTIDFGFIPPMSLGNRVWQDEGSGTTPFRSGYNNGLQDGTEVGIGAVTVQLWRDTNGTPGLQVSGGTPDTLMYSTATDASGYYLFERLQPASDYFVYIPASNFAGAGALVNYVSSTDTTAPADDAVDVNDNGIDSGTPATTGIASQRITMAYGAEPLTPANETDINNSGPYGPQNRGNFGQADADSNLTADFGFVRPPRSLGNRVWLDTNNNGKVDAGEPPIAGVHVSLYLDANGDGQPDDLGVTGVFTDDAIATDITDANGYYLFDDLPPDKYVVGIDYTNFAPGGALDGYNSSTGYADNASNNTDNLDNGIDRLNRSDAVASPHGIISTSINLAATPVGAPTGELGSGDTSSAPGFNPTGGDGPSSIGRFGETDANSDLTIDFGFFIPMSIGNRVFRDSGTGPGGVMNDGIMNGTEAGVPNVRVELYRDANTDGVPDAGGLVGFDVTDAGGYYLFDNVAEGSYVVLIPSGNFTASFDPDGPGPLPTAPGALLGYNSSIPTGTDTTGVAGNPYTPNTDRDDNGINVGTPATTGVLSGTITLAHGAEPTGEAELSAQTDPGSPANLAFSPTGWDGPVPGSRGRWGETDSNSDLTVDFGFIPVFSLGNRVFFDTNDNSARNGAEVGVNGVHVELFASDGITQIPVGPDGILGTADDAAGGMVTAGGGYYLFNNLPSDNYVVVIPASNFAVGQPLHNAWSSATTISNAGVIGETTAAAANTDIDSDDNGTLSGGDVVSSIVTLGPTTSSEPTGEVDLAAGGQGQPDGQANMTVDFGFYTMTLGNLVWSDSGTGGGGVANDGIRNGTEPGINGVTVQLWSQDGSTQLATTTTAGGGVYAFPGLAQGSYIVRVPAANFNSGGTLENFRSSTGPVPPSTYEPAPNPDTTTVDSDDNGSEVNGSLGAGGYVQTGTFALTPAGEQAVTNASGLTTENRVDFGFISLVAIGNRLWFDTGAAAGHANNGILDADETGVDDGVTVQLYSSAGSLLATTTTNTVGVNKGYYQFDRLYPGTYYVFVPATEFQAGGKLQGYYSTFGNGADETSDQNLDENGIDAASPATTGIRSTNFTLLGGTEATSEDQANYTGSLPDSNVNFTADFGFTQKYSIGNRVWFDTNNNGQIDLPAEQGVDGVTVNLYNASDLATIVATATTANGGYYLFDDLYGGDYVVSIAASNFSGAGKLVGYWSSQTTRTPAGVNTETTAALVNGDVDLDDNGTLQTSGPLNGAVISSTLTLGPSGDTEPTGETDLQPVVGQGNQPDGRANMTADFGFYTMNLGNLVWSDADKNGAFNGGETGIVGMPVSLWSGDGSVQLASTTTGVGGLYSFTGLPQGSYLVKVTAPADVASSVDTFAAADTTNPTNNVDNNDNGVGIGNDTVSSNAVTLTPGAAQVSNTVDNATGSTSNPSLDFGFVPVFSLGNRVWYDTNDNGSIDFPNEVGVDGVTVQLYASDGVTEIPVGPDGILGTADDAAGGMVTANGGYYRFNDLPSGDYIVVVSSGNFTPGGALNGYWSSGTTMGLAGVTSEPAAALANSDIDSDDNGTLQNSAPLSGAVVSSVVTLGPATTAEPAGETDLGPGGQGQADTQANMTVDFGFYAAGIGNLVYLDGNGNGNYDGVAPDSVISGARVKLFASNGSSEIMVGPDGVLGTADDAVGGVTTTAGGLYHFGGLPAGNYIVKTDAPTGMTSTIDSFSAADSGNPATNVDNNDNGVGIGFGTVSANALALTPGSAGALNNNTITQATGTTVDNTVDFGFVGMVALGNRVWFDTGAGGGISNNGILDGGETGVPQVTVELHKSAGGALVASTQTDASGYYQFDQLYPDTYYVFIPATEFQAGGKLQDYYSSLGNGADETSDQNVDENGIDDASPASNGIRSTDYSLAPGTEVTGEDQSNYSGVLADDSVNFTADLGFTQKYSIGNRVWFDTNNNGQIDLPAEQGIDGVTVNLYKSSDLATVVATATTANGGYYLFDDLYPGDYVVAIPAANFAGVLNGYWSSGTTRSPAGLNSEITAALANSDTDLDDNGTLQTGGPFNGAVLSSTITLGPSGNTEPTGETDLQPVVGQGNQPDGRANMTVDFGFYTMSLGNLVWSDIDKNGAFGAGETGIAGMPVSLWSADGTLQLASTTTGVGGLYSFTGLTEGSYLVQVTAPADVASSVDTFAVADTTNPTNNVDNNDNGVGTGSGTVSSNAVTLTPGLAQSSNTVDNATGSTDNPSLDFGFIPVFSLGNRVWFDTDNSGTLNGAETGIDGVTVDLYAAGDLTTILGTQTTANGGYYLFNDLPAGDYVVSISASNFTTGVLKGYWSSSTARAANGSLTEATAALANTDTDSDDNGILQNSGPLNGAVLSSVVTLGPAATAEPSGEIDLDTSLPGNHQGQPDTQANMTVDFGFYTMQIGDLVWNDLDNSGLLDGAEVGIDGVTVELRSSDDSTSLGTTTTAGGGIYNFSGLPAGDYIVRLPAANFNPGGVLRNYRSSTGPLPALAYEPAPDADVDFTNSDDNGSEAGGVLGLGGYIETLPVTLTPAAEDSFSDATGTTNEFRVDLGVNNSPQIDLSVTKTDNQTFYMAGETLNYVIVVTNHGPADANGMTVTDTRPAQIASWTWTCAAGTPAGYNCTGDASNPATFTDSLDLPQLASVTYDVTAQVDPAATLNLVNSVTVIPPPGMTDMTPGDNTATDTDQPASLTITKDDGLQIVSPDFTTTYTITVTNNGVADLTGLALVDTTPPGMSFVSASAGGTFNSGTSQITWPLFNLASGASQPFTVQLKVADLASLGAITSFTNTVHVQDDGTHTSGVPLQSQANDTDQLATGAVKSLIATDQPGSADPNVLIGEILTYSIRIDIPVGTVNDLQAVDTLDHGLAFVGCDLTSPVSSGTLVLAKNPCTTPGALIVKAVPVTDLDPESVNAGRRVTFNFGQVQNNSAATQSLVLNYQVIVLDIGDNVAGVKDLKNNVTWKWEGGSLSGQAPGVNIVEPQFYIKKSVNPAVAIIGSTVSYTIEVGHSSQSTAPAYDVKVTDDIPGGLALDQSSVVVNGSSGLPTAVVTTDATHLKVYWASFPLGEKATITFQAKFIGPSPVLNTSFVQWSSIQIDPAPPLQPKSLYNKHSTERRYDPLTQTLNDYRTGASANLKTPSLPQTGFAPGERTILPAQPPDKAYDSLGNLWLEIPSLKLAMPIVGVPASENGWDLTWLTNQAGYLEGTTYPSQVGTTGITGHVYLADGTPGPFLHLGNLAWGDQVILHANGQRYIFEVRENRVVLPSDLSVFRNDGYTWLTLLTCKDYLPSLKNYDYRQAVRAVLVRVEAGP